MSGTPEKILEHLLEMMRLDSHFTESGSAQHAAFSLSDWCHLMQSINMMIIYCEGVSSALSSSLLAFLSSVLRLLLCSDLFVLIYN